MTRFADIAPIPLTQVEEDLAAAAAAFGDSFRRTGFAVVSGHGVPDAVVADALAAMRAFFALPEDVKRGALVPGQGGARGFTPFGVETAKDATHHDLKEFWHVGRELPPGHPFEAFMPPNIWPAMVPEFRGAALALFDALDAAGRRILRAVAVHLGLAPDAFDDPCRDGNSVLRLLHYPPVSEDAGPIRAGAHEDINVITLLLGADEAGLQLLSNGEWLDVEAPPGTLVCNIGDMLQRFTGGLLPSTTHRVVNPAPARRHLPRYSTPFFLHYRPDYLIQPMHGDAAPITANDYLMQRLREIKLL
ncbi:isopenicillin N synthase family dioxygenase [Sandaracinobacteroides saxicola]|uniref:2-oxoglutarate-dependent ethylene/succinate-forming enzyme n=1 Tax=Sandaracinobacteroides saxicola TaxID=2759707 RepID=A0A7G5IG59_9SPHN|nr:isopenicillin N synthase family oxygenase [Sandaracinobacteroides saxicola]QMW22351.1 isopenicillin N synthase family oxygenase [Sandaracinobacteroides saxicola]